MYYAFCITPSKTGGRKFWNRIGTAWVNRDGSINIELFATSVDGKLQLRKPPPKDESDE
jgi:hypothetical protein